MPERVALGARDRRLLAQADAVIGVDEVGRGALAGPVVVCAARFAAIPRDVGIQDSKQLTANQRESALARLSGLGVRWAVCEVGPAVIDRINILEATRLAMRAAALALAVPSDAVITDHLDPGDLGCRVLSPAGADREYFCVAAASIIAKTTRDAMLDDLDGLYPGYGFARHKGYPTAAHLEALARLGPCPAHRRSFAPVAQRLLAF